MEKSWQGHYVKLSVMLMGTIGIEMCALTFPVKWSKHWVVGDVRCCEVVRRFLSLDGQSHLTAAGAAHWHLNVLLVQQLSSQRHDLLLWCRLQVCGALRCNVGRRSVTTQCVTIQDIDWWQHGRTLSHSTWVTILDDDWSQHGRILSHITETQYWTMIGHNMGGS